VKAGIALVKDAWSRWTSHNAPRLGASLAYYSLLSLAPLLVLMVTICSLVLTKATVEAQLITQVQALAGPRGASAVRMLIRNAHTGSGGIFATLAAFGTLLVGASGVFVELRDSLNVIWDAPPKGFSSWRSVIWQRMVSFGMVLALGFLLLVSLILSAAVAVIEKFFFELVPFQIALISEAANFIVSLLAVGALFALIFKFVPDVPISWRDVSLGALATALLFSIGKGLLSLYLSTAAVGSTYGAAGSVVALVVWVYYSAQIFFFGATLTRAYADTYGSHKKATGPPLGVVPAMPDLKGRGATA
jgi:membrane protein